MDFRTEIKPTPHRGAITHTRPVMMIGSCFSDNVGRRLELDLFDTAINPWGTLYNPLSIQQAIRRLETALPYSADELITHEGLCHSPLHHSSFSAATAEEALRRMNASLAHAREMAEKGPVVIITLGTTRVFADGESGAVVANCHKLPASRFTERRLSAADVADALTDTIATLKGIAPDTQVILTVSPIRHTGFGLEENSLSKATLRVGVSEAIERHPDTIYFPSYEIMIDDLRDYRFYAADMKHPSEVAIDYIYDLFCAAMMTDETRALAARCRALTRRLSHRRLTDSPAAAVFATATREMAEALAAEHPCIAAQIEKFIAT